VLLCWTGCRALPALLMPVAGPRIWWEMQQTWLTRQYSCPRRPQCRVAPSLRCVDMAFMEMALCLAYYAMRSTLLLMRHLTFARAPSTQHALYVCDELISALRDSPARLPDACASTRRRSCISSRKSKMIVTLPSTTHAFLTNAAASLSAHFPQSKDLSVESSLRIRCPY
jgi:hypothetical protein